MSNLGPNCRRIVVATTGFTLLGAGVATSALAATAAPDLPAPPSLDTAPAGAATGLLATVAPDPSHPPVPVVFQPVDSTNGLFGVRRGSVPAVATPDLQGLPVAEQLPSLEVVGLPSKTKTAGPSASNPSASNPSASNPSASNPSASNTALSTLDDGAVVADMVAAARQN